MIKVNNDKNKILSVESIIKQLNSDLYSYQEYIDEINKVGVEKYFTIEKQKYWSDWFNGSDMKNW